MYRFNLIVFFAVSFLFSQIEYNHSEFNWHTFDTNHFKVHFHDETEATAREAVTVAERIYGKVTAFYDFEPSGKTHLVLMDPDDYSNGAAYYYDNKIMIWASPLDFELRGSHRWLQNVITHEFTHIVTLQKAMKAGTRFPGAYVQLMNYEQEKRPDVLYGYPNTLVSYPVPGTVVPPWLAEGIAQFMYDGADWDHWDTHRDMILRDRAINNNLLSFTEMNTFGKKGIGNESTYNSGFALSRYIVSRYGSNTLKDIMIELSKPWQYSIDKTIANVTGISGDELYKAFKAEVESRYARLARPIQINLVEGRQIITAGSTNIFPKWQPGKKAFAYLSNKENDYFGQTDLYIYDMDSGEEEKISSAVFSAPTWHPDGQKIFYSKKPKFPNRNGSKFYDLYCYNLSSEKETRLTYDARAFNPVFIARDSSLAYLATYDGSQDIFILDLKTMTVRRTTDFDQRPMISYLSYAADYHSLTFDITTHHYRDIGKIDLNTGETTLLMNNPHWDERNMATAARRVSIFSDDRTGIYNLYLMNPVDSAMGFITNTAGGAFMPDMDEQNRILYSLYKNGSYTIAILDSFQVIDEVLVGYPRSFHETHQGFEPPMVELDPAIAEPYDDQFTEMFIMPKIMVDYGTVKPGFYFYSGEIINRLSLFGGASVNQLKDTDLFFNFEFKRFYPTLFFETYYVTRNTSDSSLYQGVYPIDDDIKFRLVQFRGGLKVPIFGSLLELYASRQWYRAFINEQRPTEGLKAGAAYDYFRGWNLSASWKLDVMKKRLDGGINPSNGFAIWINTNIEKNKFIQGLNFSDSGTLTEKFVDYDLTRLQAGSVYHYELPWIKRWTMSLKAEAGWISDNSVDSFFHFYLGGLPGLKGYSFYSIQGTRKALAEYSFRIPLFREKHYPLLWTIFQNSTIGAILQIGDAWTAADNHAWKKSVGIQWRINGFSFYNFPTAIEVEYHQPLNVVRNEHVVQNSQTTYEKEPRTYFKILFDF